MLATGMNGEPFWTRYPLGYKLLLIFLEVTYIFEEVLGWIAMNITQADITLKDAFVRKISAIIVGPFCCMPWALILFS